MKVIKLTFALMILLIGAPSFAQYWSTGISSGGPGTQTPTGVAEMPDGSRIVIGTYRYGHTQFGDYPLLHSNGNNSPTRNGFIVKYSSTNSVLWATRITTASDIDLSSVCVDNSGNIYVCGAYLGITPTCSFYNVNGSDPYITLTHNPVPSEIEGVRGFVVKYDVEGEVKWARLGIGNGITDDENINEVAVNDNGTKLVVTGRIDVANNNVPITVNSTVANGKVSDGSYVLWLNPANGASQMGFNYTNDGPDAEMTYRNGLCFDHADNVIVAGQLDGTSYTVRGYFGSTKSVQTTTTNVSTLYAKYNASGTILWAHATRANVNTTRSLPSSIIVDDDNNIYIGGAANPLSANYSLWFRSGLNSYAITVPVLASTGHAYVVKLEPVNGYAIWRGYARGATGDMETISLAKGPCDLVYAAVNCRPNPTFTAANEAVQTTTTNQTSILTYKLNTSGIFQSQAPWAIHNPSILASEELGFIATRASKKVHCTATITSNVSLQTGASSAIVLPASDKNVLLATFNDNSAAPNLTLNPTGTYCPNATIPLSASATGGGPYTYTWSIYNSTNNTYVTLGTTTNGAFSLTPSMYTPYIFNLGGSQVIYIRVGVTNCSGVTDYEYRYITFSPGITYTQVNYVEVCYNASSVEDAVFSVTGQNVTAYTGWQYSPPVNPPTWSACTPFLGMNVNGNTLTVTDSYSTGLDGYLFRCVMQGCGTVYSDPAELSVVPCRSGTDDPDDDTPQQSAAGPNGSSLSVKMYPNPAHDRVNLSVTTADRLSGEWTVQVRDMTGRILHLQPIENGECTIATDRFAEGHYLCTVLHNGTIARQEKLVIAH